MAGESTDDGSSGTVTLDADTSPFESALNKAVERAKGWSASVTAALEKVNSFSAEKISHFSEKVDLVVFGFSAGTAFLIVAALLALTDRRWISVLSLLFQVSVYVTYIGVSGGREPAFEIWGITLRLIQLVVIASLFYLIVTPRSAAKEIHT